MGTGPTGLRVYCVPKRGPELLIPSLVQTRHKPKTAQGANKIVYGETGWRGQLVQSPVGEGSEITQE
jgi:hypothetical protein